MSWLFSRGLVEECLEQQNLAYPLSVQLSWIGTADAFLSSDRMTEFSRRSLPGMMFAIDIFYISA